MDDDANFLCKGIIREVSKSDGTSLLPTVACFFFLLFFLEKCPLFFVLCFIIILTMPVALVMYFGECIVLVRCFFLYEWTN